MPSKRSAKAAQARGNSIRAKYERITFRDNREETTKDVVKGGINDGPVAPARVPPPFVPRHLREPSEWTRDTWKP